MGDLTKYDIELQLEEITSLTTSKDELSATLDTLKTENITLAGQIKESVETIKKFADEKKTIGGQLEEANNSTKLLQGKLGDMQTKVESTEKLMAKVNEELQAKVKANTTISVQLEEATKNSNLLQGKLSDMESKVETTEKLMAKLKEEMQTKLKGSAASSEGKAKKQKTKTKKS